jgi:hypothetical protein
MTVRLRAWRLASTAPYKRIPTGGRQKVGHFNPINGYKLTIDIALAVPIFPPPAPRFIGGAGSGGNGVDRLFSKAYTINQ